MSRTRGKILSAWHTSHNFDRRKRITQPSGAATPRNSDAHKRIAVPKAFCVLWEHPRPRPKSGKTCRSGTRPGDVGERAERSESSDTTPIRNAPCFGVQAAVCDPLSKGECVPAFTRESERGPFVGEVEKRDEKRFGAELRRQLFDDIYGNGFGRKAELFKPDFWTVKAVR